MRIYRELWLSLRAMKQEIVQSHCAGSYWIEPCKLFSLYEGSVTLVPKTGWSVSTFGVPAVCSADVSTVSGVLFQNIIL